MLPDNLLLSSDIPGELQDLIESNRFTRTAILVDENTERDCLPEISSGLKEFDVIRIPSGEKNKTINTCEQIWSRLSDWQFDRKSLLINLGGGVICDMGGFAASTYKRGISFINIPTTLLAQVDASIGGKTGIDFKGYKNQIGLFREPLKIIVFAGFLKTLPEKETRSGFAEIIKHCLIADAKYFDIICDAGNLEDQKWNDLIMNSISIKQSIVSADPFESGPRKALNFGHTIGHGIESVFLGKEHPLLHGEAIAIGIICESFLSMEKNSLDKRQLDRITRLISNVFEKVEISPEEMEKILSAIMQDKKNEGGEIRITLIPEIGKVSVNQMISIEDARKSLSFYNSMVWHR